MNYFEVTLFGTLTFPFYVRYVALINLYQFDINHGLSVINSNDHVFSSHVKKKLTTFFSFEMS